uniref:MYB transcription factor 1 n=1 Tax=Camellia sinensis TaxID=4442 RepID=F8SPH0_CAMSI|nr:MYB transcription factor 1 [Camellia sinensis]
MSSFCSESATNGHNSHTEIMLFGVRVKVDPMRKSVSMSNLSQYEQPQESSNVAAAAAGYASADEAVHHHSSGNRERKRGVPWTEEEHKLFLLGLKKVGKGDWRGISRDFVKTRTPTQVASHAQKYFLRRMKLSRRRRRSSLFDITNESVTVIPMEEENLHHPPLESTNIGGSQVVPFPVTVGAGLLPVQIENPMEKLALGHISQSNPMPVLLFSDASSTMVDSNLNQKSTVDPSRLSLKLSLSSDQNQSSTRSASLVMSSINNGDNIISVA